MQEFSSISVSSYESGSLADRLTEQSADGWSVVAIVPTGSTVTAYLSRDAGASVGAADTAVPDPVSPDPVSPDPVSPDPVTPDAIAPDPVAEAPGWAATTEAVPAAEHAMPEATAAPSTGSSEAEPVAAVADPAAGAAPAGWYADPSSRFELRYWDGSQWTEHVSRAGQQYTDPPVA